MKKKTVPFKTLQNHGSIRAAIVAACADDPMIVCSDVNEKVDLPADAFAAAHRGRLALAHEAFTKCKEAQVFIDLFRGRVYYRSNDLLCCEYDEQNIFQIEIPEVEYVWRYPVSWEIFKRDIVCFMSLNECNLKSIEEVDAYDFRFAFERQDEWLIRLWSHAHAKEIQVEQKVHRAWKAVGHFGRTGEQMEVLTHTRSLLFGGSLIVRASAEQSFFFQLSARGGPRVWGTNEHTITNYDLDWGLITISLQSAGLEDQLEELNKSWAKSEPPPLPEPAEDGLYYVGWPRLKASRKEKNWIEYHARYRTYEEAFRMLYHIQDTDKRSKWRSATVFVGEPNGTIRSWNGSFETTIARKVKNGL